MRTPTLSGALWAYAGNLYQTVGQFVVGVFLARMLGPADFGVFIAVTAYTSVLMLLVQFGLPQAVLQAKTLTPAQSNAAFWLMAALATCGFGLSVFLAGALAPLYGAAEFTGVFIWMSASLLLMPYTAMGLALLRRDMRFDEVARMDMLAFTLSAALGLLAAVLGAGVYSLVIAGLAAMLTNTVSIARRLRWHPRWPAVKAAGGLLRYARFVTINNVIGVSGSRVDNMVIGAVLGTTALGLYNRAYSLARIPSDQFADSIGPLLLGALARIQDDVAASRRQWFKAVAAIALVTWPFLVALLVSGPAMITLLYGAAWQGAGTALQVMVVGAACLVPVSALRGLINAQGLVSELVAVNLWSLAATLVAVTLLAPFGIVGIAVGISLREVLLFWLLLRLVGRSKLHITAAEVLTALLPALWAMAAGAVVGGLVLWGLQMRGVDGLLALTFLPATAGFIAYAAVTGVLMWRWPAHEGLAASGAIILSVLGRLRSATGR